MEPGDAKRRLLNELVSAQADMEEKLKTQERMIRRFQAMLLGADIFGQVIDCFPYPIAVFLPNGRLRLANPAMLAAVGPGGEAVLDFGAQSKTGFWAAVEQALSGRTVFFSGACFPFARSCEDAQRDVPACSDAVVFPLTDGDGRVSHAAAVLLGAHAAR